MINNPRERSVEEVMVKTPVPTELLRDFIRESNRIEGILREPYPEEMSNTDWFLSIGSPRIEQLEALAQTYEVRAVLRDDAKRNVRVGNHIAPPGGPEIVKELNTILDDAHANKQHPFIIHQSYETLHPFMDGNGRSGRALWAWQMLHHNYRPGIQLGFLHAFYYQALEHRDAMLNSQGGCDE